MLGEISLIPSLPILFLKGIQMGWFLLFSLVFPCFLPRSLFSWILFSNHLSSGFIYSLLKSYFVHPMVQTFLIMNSSVNHSSSSSQISFYLRIEWNQGIGLMLSVGHALICILRITKNVKLGNRNQYPKKYNQLTP